ncbi:MAG: hypothetical protein HXX14_21360 [Bacteroidetes bacterium]|nr:hypothetical protein [Bacteroidota bacterium]
MKKLVISLIALLTASTTLMAQNEVDALRFSRLMYGGSARYMSLGGAYGAVGADFSATSTNPAGMGLYKRSEVSFTPAITTNKASSTFGGYLNEDTKYGVNIGSAGIVMVFGNPNNSTNSEWRSFQWGFGYNRLASFNNNYLIKGKNTSSSILQNYIDRAKGTAPADLSPFDTQLAYDVNLIYRDDPNQNIYTADFLKVKLFPGVDQTKSIQTKGGIGETVFAGSANYMDRIYFGASLGILSLRYEEESTFTETPSVSNTIPEFTSLTKYDYQLIKGTGYNLKVGVIFRATDWLRLGAAVHTPALFTKLNIDYNSSMSSTFKTSSFNATKDSPNGTYTFDMTTPMKVIGSAAIVIGKSGLISADYELVDYSASRLRPSSDFTVENQRIQDKYTSTSNFRLGGEYRLGMLSFRGGYGIFGSPYKSNVNDGQGTLYSLGVGYRSADYFVDLGYSSYQMTEDYYLYGGSAQNAASVKTTNNTFMVTFGVKF